MSHVHWVNRKIKDLDQMLEASILTPPHFVHGQSKGLTSSCRADYKLP